MGEQKGKGTFTDTWNNDYGNNLYFMQIDEEPYTFVLLSKCSVCFCVGKFHAVIPAREAQPVT
jgi:hypothetical protein